MPELENDWEDSRCRCDQATEIKKPYNLLFPIGSLINLLVEVSKLFDACFLE